MYLSEHILHNVCTVLLILVASCFLYTECTDLIRRYIMDIDVKTVGQRIRTARKTTPLTIEQLAERVGIASESLAHIECGSRKPSLSLLFNIANELNVSLDYLSGRTPAGTQSLINELANTEELTLRQRQAFIDMANSMIAAIKRNI